MILCPLCQKELVAHATPSDYLHLPMPDELKDFHCPTKVDVNINGTNWPRPHYQKETFRTGGKHILAYVLPFAIQWESKTKQVKVSRVVTTAGMISQVEDFYSFQNVEETDLTKLYERFKNLIAFS